MERARRRWWTRLVTAGALLVVIAATLSGLFRLAMEAVPGYRQTLQARISAAIGAPLHIGAIQLTWRGFQPGLALDDVDLLNQDHHAYLHVQALRLDASLPRLLHGELTPDRIVVSGLTLTLAVNAAGHWSLPGLPGGGGGDDQALRRALDAFHDLHLKRCTLLLDDARLHGAPQPFMLDARLEHHAGEYRLHASAQPPPGMAGSAAVNLVLRGDPLNTHTWSGSWNASLSGVRSLPWLDRLLPSDTTLAVDSGRVLASGHLQQGRLVDAQARISATAVAALHHASVAAQSNALQADVNLQRIDQGWQLALPEMSLIGTRGKWSLRGHATLKHDAQGHSQVELDLQRLRLDDLQPWLALWPQLDKNLKQLPHLHGDIEQLALRAEPQATGGARYSVHGDLADVGWAPADGRPGIDHLSGHVAADQDGGRFQLAATPPVLDAPTRFGMPIAFDALDGVLQWQHGDAGWTLQLPDLRWQLQGSQGSGHVSLDLPASGTGPVIDLALDFSADDATRLKPLMPLTWGAGLRVWLQRGLVHGQVSAGHVEIKGSLADFPYVDKTDGHWGVDLTVDHGVLDYAPGWPVADHLSAQLKFRGNGLQITSRAVQIDGIPLDSVKARFVDFNDHQLQVDLDASSGINRFYDLLRHSPLHAHLSSLLDRTEASGPAQVHAHLMIPLQKAVDTEVSGSARLKGVRLRYQDIDQPMTDLQGDLEFDNDGVRADDLHGQLYDTQVQADIVTTDASPSGVLQARFDADTDASGGLVGAFVPAWLQARLHGRSQWQARLPFGGDDGGHLRLSSDLIGTAIELPAPLAKPAAAALPLTLTLMGGSSQPLRLDVDGGDRFEALLRFGGTGGEVAPAAAASAGPPAADHTRGLRLHALGLRLGPGARPDVAQDGLQVSGTAPEVDLGALFALLGAAPWAADGDGAGSAPALPFIGADISSDDVWLDSYHLQPLHVVVAPTADGLHLTLDGAGAAGVVDWKRDANTVQARLQHLALQPMPTTTQPPVTASTATKSTPIDPRSLPALDLQCAATRIGDYPLGKFVLLSRHTVDGQRLDQIELSGARVTLQGSGAWQRDDRGAGSTAQLGFRLNVKRLGAALVALGFTRNISAQSAEFSGSLGWPAATAGLDLAQASGKVQIKLKSGMVKAVRPGAGRILGLLNIYALPRRLLFNFSDVVDKGLAFDSVNGDFDVGDGKAITHNLAIVGPSLHMDVRGRIGLKAQDFDEIVTVYPDISTGVTLGATLLGGPVAGGIALLAQQLVGKALDKLTQLSYHVTGSWDNPKVVRTGEEHAPAPAVKVPNTSPEPGPAGKDSNRQKETGR